MVGWVAASGPGVHRRLPGAPSSALRSSSLNPLRPPTTGSMAMKLIRSYAPLVRTGYCKRMSPRGPSRGSRPAGSPQSRPPRTPQRGRLVLRPARIQWVADSAFAGNDADWVVAPRSSAAGRWRAHGNPRPPTSAATNPRRIGPGVPNAVVMVGSMVPGSDCGKFLSGLSWRAGGSPW